MEQLQPYERLLADYEMGPELGRGASSVCYLCTHRSSGVPSVVKRIDYAFTPHLQSALLREIALLKTVHHPNLIRFAQAYSGKGALYIVSDYQQEQDLMCVIKEAKRAGRVEWGAVWKVFRQVLAGLAYLHGAGIVHRDLKPSNIFVNAQWEVRIGDLGAAKLAGVDQLSYTRVGTPYYLPPEIIRCEPYTSKADVWSLGVTIYHLACLALPFQGQNIIRLGQAITYQQPHFPSHLPVLLTQALEAMLQKQEANRPTAQQLFNRFFEQVNPLQEGQLVENSATQVIIDEADHQDWNCLPEQSASIQQYERKDSKSHFLPAQIAQEVHFQRTGSSIDRQEFAFTRQIGTESKRVSEHLERLEKGDVIKEQSLGRTQLEDNDETIVLTVNPNDFNNFSGYYKDSSARSSKIHFSKDLLRPDCPQKTKLKLGRKSSLFKNSSIERNPNKHNSIFLNRMKENQSCMEARSVHQWYPSHQRQNSLINANRHHELMRKLKAVPNRREQLMARVYRPELIILSP